MTVYGRSRNPGKIDPEVRGGYGAVVADLGPIHFWVCDEASGSTLNDSAGSNPLTLTGGTLSAGGPLGRYVNFDGVDDYAAGLGVSLTGEWSAVAVVRVDVAKISQIVGVWNGGQYWTLAQTATGIEMYTKPDPYTGFGASVSLTGAWHVVGCSRRSGTSSLYVDGVQVATGSASAVGSVGGTNTRLARHSGGTYFDGGMCGVAVFNKALSTADHEAIAAAAVT